MVTLYKTDCSGLRKDFVASFNTEQEAINFINTHPQEFTKLLPLIK